MQISVSHLSLSLRQLIHPPAACRDVQLTHTLGRHSLIRRVENTKKTLKRQQSDHKTPSLDCLSVMQTVSAPLKLDVFLYIIMLHDKRHAASSRI